MSGTPNARSGPKTGYSANIAFYNRVPVVPGPDAGERVQNLRRHNDPPTPGTFAITKDLGNERCRIRKCIERDSNNFVVQRMDFRFLFLSAQNSEKSQMSGTIPT